MPLQSHVWLQRDRNGKVAVFLIGDIRKTSRTRRVHLPNKKACEGRRGKQGPGNRLTVLGVASRQRPRSEEGATDRLGPRGKGGAPPPSSQAMGEPHVFRARPIQSTEAAEGPLKPVEHGAGPNREGRKGCVPELVVDPLRLPVLEALGQDARGRPEVLQGGKGDGPRTRRIGLAVPGVDRREEDLAPVVHASADNRQDLREPRVSDAFLHGSLHVLLPHLNGIRLPVGAGVMWAAHPRLDPRYPSRVPQGVDDPQEHAMLRHVLICLLCHAIKRLQPGLHPARLRWLPQALEAQDDAVQQEQLRGVQAAQAKPETAPDGLAAETPQQDVHGPEKHHQDGGRGREPKLEPFWAANKLVGFVGPLHSLRRVLQPRCPPSDATSNGAKHYPHLWDGRIRKPLDHLVHGFQGTSPPVHVVGGSMRGDDGR
mmetsp:Transcript_4250/g.10287  ORF Transcript_4250/g.10287 Transcript_4250/m.10287 type:complete len:427 (-) Transcript_4250:2417-3697(-)